MQNLGGQRVLWYFPNWPIALQYLYHVITQLQRAHALVDPVLQFFSINFTFIKATISHFLITSRFESSITRKQQEQALLKSNKHHSKTKPLFRGDYFEKILKGYEKMA